MIAVPGCLCPLSARLTVNENRQLSRESTLEGGARFAAGDIGGEVRIFVQYSRWLGPEQHTHHHEVACAERAIEPVGIAKTAGKLAKRFACAIVEQSELVPEKWTPRSLLV